MKKFILIILCNILFFGSNILYASEGASADTFSQIAGLIVFILVIILFLIFFVYSSPKYIYKPEDSEAEVKESLIAKLSRIFNRGVPIEKEKDIMLDHDFDGIKELNNSIPPWFNILFYGTIVFAAVYMLNYHVFGSGDVMVDEYLQEIKIANEKREELIRTGAFINENNVTVLTDAADLEKGKQLYNVNCTPCHGPDGGGTVGPNLTDKYWIHGGGIKNVFKTITEGVPAKGMIAWKTLLTPKQIQQVASYVLSLQGTNPPSGKPHEGELWLDSADTKSNKNIDTSKTNNNLKKDTINIKSDTSKLKTDTNKIKSDTNKLNNINKK